MAAYYDADYNMVDDHNIIAKEYVQSWFIIDTISIIPFDLLFVFGNFNRLARVARIGKLYKIIRMTRMVRMLKIVKERNKLVKYLNEILKIGVGFERLLFMMLIFLVLQHVAACVWVFVARFDPTDKMNWIYQGGFQDYQDYQLYVCSFYFTVTTIVTVGFGDIHAYNVGEQVICIFLMLIGVISFSFATGSLSSIISNYDSSQAKLKEKIAILNEIKAEYKIGPDLFDELMKTIKYDHSKNQRDITVFVSELPYKLRIDLAMEIHKTIYSTIDFFKVKEKSFIAWIGPLLKPLNVQELEYIFKEGEDIKEVFFLVNGVAGYVLPRFDNTVYIKIEKGDHFGHVDLVLDQEIMAAQLNVKRRERNLTRKFTVQALIDCELLMLLIEDIDKMKIEFPDVFDELFMNSYRRLKKELEIKIKAIQLCEQATQSSNTQSQNAINSIKGLSKKGTFQLQEYKERKLKKKLTLSDINIVSKFAQNTQSLKQIDEEMEYSSITDEEIDEDEDHIKEENSSQEQSDSSSDKGEGQEVTKTKEDGNNFGTITSEDQSILNTNKFKGAEAPQTPRSQGGTLEKKLTGG